MSERKFEILMLGASYGSLFATKLALAGHNVTLVCLPAEAELINNDGVRVRMPVRGRDGLVEVHSKALPGRISACGPEAPKPADFDMVGLAMQEPQYRSPGVRELLDAIGRAGTPCVSIMNMPPLPYLARIPDLDTTALEGSYTDPSVWKNVAPKNITLCSPDPQAFRPPEEPVNVLQVSLPTNFKAARFERDADTAMLQQIADDIEQARFTVDGEALTLPVKLKVHDSLFVPFAKWSMLLTGNYRCVQEEAARSIREAVHTDIDASRSVYAWVDKLCQSLGAAQEDQVPFEKYAKAAESLAKPSSAARALFAGAPNIERVDRLVRSIAQSKGIDTSPINRTVDLVDARLGQNRSSAA
ncbi:MAG: hypothetical protein KTR21_00310 [Rhodobacteraceae bacterium]|nr:hypothetical protein [Paracoccaceae bacterium]